MKKVVAVAPYWHNNSNNFKTFVYNTWKEMGGAIMPSHYPKRIFHKFAYSIELPAFHKNKRIAQLRFAESASLSFDTFPEYAKYEIIPFIWDCWPSYFEKTCQWFIKYNVRTAIFTSSQTADRMKKRFPMMNILAITEGINVSLYERGKNLNERIISLYEIGSVQRSFFKKRYPEDYQRLCNIPNDWSPRLRNDFLRFLAETKVTIIFPKCMTQPEITGDIETLTQRYWECMLSRMVMVGHAPKELIKLIGYNPVIPVDINNPASQVETIINNINNYQTLVDKNRETALEYAPWNIRIKSIMEWLSSCGYSV